ncbi:MAG: DUF3320 domain-containing protein [Roseiarcus sp.]
MLADAQLRLVETGTRNRLVHTPRSSKRTRSLAMVDADADSLFEAVARSGKAIRFQPTATGRSLAPHQAGGEDEDLRQEVSQAPGNTLQTNLEPETLEKRLLALYRDAKTAEEEQGINILFLAIGFLRWYEDDRSEVLREAPLVLVPVTLIREPRRSIFYLKGRDDDIATNQAIQERLRSDFSISLPDIPEDEDWRPSDYFAALQQAISVKSRWSIEPNGVELGFYSFSKLLMIRDLDPGSWPENAILDHPLLRGLLSDGFNEEPTTIPPDAKLDQLFAPSDLVQVVDADSSQTIVIENVRTGRNLVVQGPPGTGKSQTITNIIASAVHDGKTVLFVAEKMAALDVVHHRLKKAGLGPICLELHSRSANKKQVLAEVEATLDDYVEEPDSQAQVARLTELRATLNAAAERMHTLVGDTGMTPFQAVSRLIAAAETKIASYSPLLREASTWSKSDYAKVVQAAAALIEVTAEAGPCHQHPYFGVEATSLEPAELERLAPSLTQLATTASALAVVGEKALAVLGLSADVTIGSCLAVMSLMQRLAMLERESAVVAMDISAQNTARILEAAQVGIAWSRLRAVHSETFVEAAWSTPAVPLRASLATGLSLFGRLWGKYRRGSSLLASLIKTRLPKKPSARIELVDRLIEVEKAHEHLVSYDAAMSAMAARHWRKERTDFNTLFSAAEVMQALKTDQLHPDIDQAVEVLRNGAPAKIALELKRAVDELIQASDVALSALRVNVAKAFGVHGRDQVSLRTFAAKASQWRDSMERFDQWRRLSAADEALRSKSAAALAEALATGVVKAERTKAILACTHAETVWKKAVEQTPALQHFQGLQHNQLAGEFRSLEAKRRTTTIEIVRSRHSTKMPRGSYGAMHTIRSEVKRKRGHMPIRKLFKAAGETLQRIKPVLLMSPISVAQFLAPGSAHFDLLVIDEASQVRPEDALGLVVRATQIVVVGDNKQLPPTSFFDRVIADEEDDEVNDDAPETALSGAAKATELESILALCEARGLNSAMLRWHYRSRHPSLIEVSNAEFYRRLVMPPAPSSQRSSEGLILTRVAGAYDRGGKRINAIEAEAVAKAVARHATVTPDLSLGVATFSSVQRDAISDLLDIMRRTDDSLDAFLREGKTEDIFVKNLENVQGDERDVIFVSVGYGPRTVGSRLDSMAFGPVSMEGGERRLNVLFTRARSRCEIFCSFAAGDIDLDRARGEGPRVLKRFLQYAESGVLEEQVSTSEDFDSPFEEAVASVIEGLGYKVDKQVGSAGFKIDLAVRDPEEPGRFMLAVECDGATYHHALWARERDRLRQDVLENMGWEFHRIWSTDWFYRRGNTLERLRAALEAAKHSGRRPLRAKSATPFDPQDDPPRHVAGPLPTTPSAMIPAYELANCRVPFGVEPHLAPGGEMSRITRAIVETEGPVHEDEIARRVATLFGKARTGSLISAAAIGSLRPLKLSGVLVEHDGFWMTPAQAANPPVRDRSSAPLALQRADMLSPLEIRAAAKIAEHENGTLSNEEMATAITRLLGFKRTGSDLKAAIENALEGP